MDTEVAEEVPPAVDRFLDALKGLSVEAWKGVVKRTPLGYVKVWEKCVGELDTSMEVADAWLQKRLRTEVIERIDAPAEIAYADASNKLALALAAVARPEAITGLDRVVALGPFLEAVQDELLADLQPLASVEVRKALVVSLRRTIKANRGSLLARESLLPDTRNRLEAALVLEGMTANLKRYESLCDLMIQLCNFVPDASVVPNDVALAALDECRVSRLEWLGLSVTYELPTAAIGTPVSRQAAEQENRSCTLVVVAMTIGFVPSIPIGFIAHDFGVVVVPYLAFTFGAFVWAIVAGILDRRQQQSDPRLRSLPTYRRYVIGYVPVVLAAWALIAGWTLLLHFVWHKI